MLEKPDIPDDLILSHLQEEYGWKVAQLTFLPLGADLKTAVYRAITGDGTAYFLKLRKGFNEIIVTVPLFLQAQGIREIIVPFETLLKQYWADLGEYRMLLYPFIEGKDGFEVELSDRHKRSLGAALRRIHSAQVPPQLKQQIQHETFSGQWREKVKALQRLIETKTFDDPIAAKLADFMKSKQTEISDLVEHAKGLASELQSMPLELVLCHTDIHGGNILISDSNDLYIVDWDNILLAPKERDLMFIGGGIDQIWKRRRDEDMFYESYGRAEINLKALAYYRYERIVEDLAIIGEQLLLTDKGGADRERSYGWFTGNFEPGNTIEIALQTYKLMTKERS